MIVGGLLYVVVCESIPVLLLLLLLQKKSSDDDDDDERFYSFIYIPNIYIYIYMLNTRPYFVQGCAMCTRLSVVLVNRYPAV